MTMTSSLVAVSGSAVSSFGAARTARPAANAWNVCRPRPSLNSSFWGCSPQLGKPAATNLARPSARTAECSITRRGTEVSTATKPAKRRPTRTDNQKIRMALPSKGRMAEDALQLLKDCQLSVRKLNERQYIAKMPEMNHVEVWFQRASDVVRKLRSGDVDFGIVGYDMLLELGEDDPELVVVHEALGFGQCHLALGVPMTGAYANISTFQQLVDMPCWSEEHPLRVVTGYTHIGKRFFDEKGVKHVEMTTADGALEAAPLMGTADIILDLVSSGTTLRENNLKEVDGGYIVDSQAVLVARRAALLSNPQMLETAHELIERLDAHLRAQDQFSVTANMRGASMEDVAARILKETDLHGLQGPTIAAVYSAEGSRAPNGLNYYAISIVVTKKRLYEAVQELRSIGASGVLVSPLIYIFDEEPPRWLKLQASLGLL